MAVTSSLDMTTGPFYKKLIAFSIPVMLTSLLQMFYNAADVMVVGKFAGSQALAAVSSNGSLVNLILNLFIGFSLGSGVVVARFIGAEDRGSTSRAVHTAMAFAGILGVIALVVGETLAKTLLGLMEVPEDIIDLSALYLRIFFLGTPASLVYNFGSGVLRANGDTQRPMIISAIAGIINLVLNLVFVIVFHMSVAGVALATIISQYVSAIWVILILTHRHDASRLIFKKLKISMPEFKEIIKIGLPTGLQSTCFALSNVIVQSSINSFGSVVIAGNGAASNIDNMVYVCIDSFSQATMTFVAQNVGAKKYHNISLVYRKCLVLVAAVGIILGGLTGIFAEFLVGFFTNDPQVVVYGAEKIRYLATFYFLAGFMNCTASALRSMGKPFTSMFVTLAGSCGFRILWVFTIFQIFRNLPVLYSVYTTSWTITFIALYVFYRINLKKLKMSI